MSFNDFHDEYSGRPKKAVCKRCGAILRDCEPADRDGEYYHPFAEKTDSPEWIACKNSGRAFNTDDAEIAPFRRKVIRRARHRGAVKASKLRPR